MKNLNNYIGIGIVLVLGLALLIAVKMGAFKKAEKTEAAFRK
jgi:hypothetical protein